MSRRLRPSTVGLAAIALLAPLACGTGATAPARSLVAYATAASREPAGRDADATAEGAAAISSPGSPSIQLEAAPRSRGRRCVLGLPEEGFRVAVVEVEADGSVQRIARTLDPLSPTADWSMIPDPFGPTQAAHSFHDSFSLDALDLGTYDLSPSLHAFGVRTERNEGYSGGFGTFEELTLLVIEGDRLVPVASFPIATYTMIAGDWHADGTRGHDSYTAELVVDVRAKADHVADLRLRSRHARDGALFVWNESARIYDCSDR